MAGSDDKLRAAQRAAAERCDAARPLLRQALDLSKTYLEDGAPVSAYRTLLRACEAVLEKEAQADPPMGRLLADSVTAAEGSNGR